MTHGATMAMHNTHQHLKIMCQAFLCFCPEGYFLQGTITFSDVSIKSGSPLIFDT